MASVRTLPNRDENAFRATFQQHYPVVRRLLMQVVRNGAEADELAQEVFIALLSQSFPSQRDHEVRRWLLRVALNRGLNAIRGRQRRQAREQAVAHDDVYDLEAIVESRRTQRDVRKALASLEPRAAKLLMLRQVGLSYAELAEVIDVAPGSIGTLLVRAQRAFAAAYRDTAGDEAAGGDR
jgi:RNA polymerase sigma-70 factor (ECF subfamily)